MIDVLITIGKVLGIVLYYLTMLLGLALVPLGFAGEFLIILATAVFILFAGSGVISWWVLGFLLLLGIIAEGIEFLAGMAGAKMKGSLWSGVGALAGGVLGSIIGASFALILGALVGVFVGTFLGAFLVELHICRHSGKAANVATAALVARIVGTAVKTAASVFMIAVVTVALLV